MSLRNSLVVRRLGLCFHCHGRRFSPWLGNEDPANRVVRSPSPPFQNWATKQKTCIHNKDKRLAFRQYKEPHINQQVRDSPVKSVCETQTGISKKTGCHCNIINHQGKANCISIFLYQITKSLKKPNTCFLVRLWWMCSEESTLVGQMVLWG